MKLHSANPYGRLRKHLLNALVACAVLAPWLEAPAVTDAEMDEARAITAKFYIRYINNGAGYLDNWLPKSMADLEKKLTNSTDKGNLKQFKSITTPTDYSSWDKTRLVDYWSNSFFAENAAQLDSKAASNAMCKKQIRTAVTRMEIAAPAPAAAEQPAAAEAAPAAAEQQEAQVQEELARVDGEIQEAQDLVAQEEAAAERPEKKSSGTWVYIMVLAILVAVVIFLVVYASRTMKGQPKAAKTKGAEDFDDDTRADDTDDSLPYESYQPAPVAPAPEPEAPRYDSYQPRSARTEETRIREKYAETLAAKAEEIRNLNRQLAEMETLAAGLKDENRRLKAEVEQMRRSAAAPQPSSAHHHGGSHHNAYQPQPRHSEGETREVYLGRVNSKGIFIRADRHAVDGQSIYKLTTSNGQSGTYTLINNPLIEEQVLDDPGKWLAGGCFAKDIFDTEGRQGICMETPGTAVFRDGAWRVERKAKIRYC